MCYKKISGFFPTVLYYYVFSQVRKTLIFVESGYSLVCFLCLCYCFSIFVSRRILHREQKSDRYSISGFAGHINASLEQAADQPAGSY